ncbi:MAG: hypothetical protein JWM80_5825 [Cyanobacteria bacterium RYN_339]|nr:hypothetical protein [Cyanobacteria bacterium RYN_339]
MAGKPLALGTRFAIVVLGIYVVIGALALTMFGWLNTQVAESLGVSYAQKQVLYDKARTMRPIDRELALARKLAASPLLKRWAGNEHDPALKRQAMEELESYRQNLADHSWFYVVDASHHYYFNDRSNKHGGKELIAELLRSKKSDSWYFASLEKVQDYALNIDHDANLDTTKLWINVIVRDGDKKLGISGSGVDLSEFMHAFFRQQTPGVETMLLDAQGAFQAHQDPRLIEMNNVARADVHHTLFSQLDDAAERARLQAAFRDLKEGKVEVVTQFVKRQGKRQLLAAAYLNGVDWYNVVAMDLDYNYGLTRLGPMLAVLVLALMVGVITVAWLMQRMVLRPLTHLSASAAGMARGDYDVELPIARMDEIGVLTSSFNEMAGQIKTLVGRLQAQNQDLKHLDQLKDEFLANTSHELRTPLNGMIGIADSMLLGAAGEVGEAGRYNLTLISHSGKRLLNLVNDILDFSKLRHHELQLRLKPVGVRGVVDVVLQLTQTLSLARGLEVANRVPADLPLVNADEDRLQQILHNLIGNAIKFTPEGRVAVAAEVLDGAVAIHVSDTGIGIPADKLARVFESFEQVEGSAQREYGGTGLGLAITKNLVELHGGQVQVRSVAGEGSTFTFTLPLAAGAPGPATLQPARPVPIYAAPLALGTVAPRAPEGGPTARVLVVDDEPVNVQVLVNFLAMERYELTVATDGVQALELLEAGLEPDIVLLDVMMPRLTGYEVTRVIRERWPADRLPILLLSARVQPDDIVLGLNAGANDYLAKPINRDELLARMHTQLELARAQAQLAEVNQTLETRVQERTLAAETARLTAEAASSAKSEFLARMSHEIRTPMTAMMGFADLLTDAAVPAGERDHYALIIRRNSEHLLSVINDILDLSKIEAGKLTIEAVECSLPALITDVASPMRVRAADKGLAFGVRLHTSVPAVVRTDPVRLRQILLNLAGNAVKFTELGGVTLEIRFRPSRGGGVLTIAVVDTGIGMTAEQADGLFVPFQQADSSMNRRFGGTGLGLAISRPLALALGGEIGVASAPGAGSTFTLSLPVGVPDGIGHVTTLEGADVAPPRGPNEAVVLAGRVLLAEDGPDNQVLIGTLLRKHGLAVVLAENGQEAVAHALDAVSQGRPFDLILMDIQMPILDGIGATQALRARGLTGPVVALTANAMAGERERCLAAGCDDYLTKPVDREAFLAMLTRYVASGPVAPEAWLYSAFAEDADMIDLVANFAASLPERVEGLLAVQPRDELRSKVHQLKGAAGGYGFPSITEAAAHVEQALLEQDARVPALLLELVALCRLARAGSRPAGRRGL